MSIETTKRCHIMDALRDLNLNDYLPEESVVQPLWNWVIGDGRKEYLSSPLWPILMSVAFYFACLSPFMLMDLYGRNWKWVQKLKIQNTKQVTWAQTRKAAVLTLWNHVIYILPTAVAQYVWVPHVVLPDNAPGLWEMVWQNVAMFVVFDTQYFIWHFLHHKFRFLYRHIHAFHHEYSASFCWVTQYLHPWELITVGLYTTTLPWIFKCHCLTTWVFMILNIIASIDAHIGYDIPGAGHRWIPFYGGSPKHDMHHQKPLTNYQPYFTHWDKLMGTHCPGMAAGGVKPPALIEYEKKSKSAVNKHG